MHRFPAWSHIAFSAITVALALSCASDDSAPSGGPGQVPTPSGSPPPPSCTAGQPLVEKSGLVIELVRTNITGTPTWCGARTQEECRAGDNGGPGSGEGDGRCSTTRNESLCNSWAGCNWLDDLCGGNAAATCDLGYSPLLPGCSFTDGTATCEGQPAPCAAFDHDSGSGKAGGIAKSKCQGTPSPTQADGNPLCDAGGGVYADGICTGLV